MIRANAVAVAAFLVGMCMVHSDGVDAETVSDDTVSSVHTDACTDSDVAVIDAGPPELTTLESPPDTSVDEYPFDWDWDWGWDPGEDTHSDPSMDITEDIIDSSTDPSHDTWDDPLMDSDTDALHDPVVDPPVEFPADPGTDLHDDPGTDLHDDPASEPDESTIVEIHNCGCQMVS